MNEINLTPGAALARFGWHLRNYPLSEEIWEELNGVEGNFSVLFHPVTHLYRLSDVGFNMYVGS